MAAKSVWDMVEESDFDKSEGFTSAPYMNQVGRYLLRITAHKTGPGQRDKSKIKFVPEFEVLQTAHGLHPVGCRRSDVITISTSDQEKFKTQMGKVKAHLSALLNVQQGQIKLSIVKELETNPLMFEGYLLWMDVLPEVKTKSGEMINPRQYLHIPKDQYAAVLAEAQREHRERPVVAVSPTPADLPQTDKPVAEAESDW